MAALLEYDSQRHVYYRDAREIPSVTQILEAAGLVSNFMKDEAAAKRGTDVHAWTAADDTHGVDLRSVPKEYRGYLRAWRKYRVDSGFYPTVIEERMDSEIWGYAGRIDRIGMRSTLDARKFIDVITDIKTNKSGAVPAYVKYQLVAYAHAYAPGQIFERIAVALKPDGSYNCKVYGIQDFQIDLAEWLQIVEKVKNI